MAESFEAPKRGVVRLKIKNEARTTFILCTSGTLKKVIKMDHLYSSEMIFFSQE